MPGRHGHEVDAVARALPLPHRLGDLLAAGVPDDGAAHGARPHGPAVLNVAGRGSVVAHADELDRAAPVAELAPAPVGTVVAPGLGVAHVPAVGGAAADQLEGPARPLAAHTRPVLLSL